MYAGRFNTLEEDSEQYKDEAPERLDDIIDHAEDLNEDLGGVSVRFHTHSHKYMHTPVHIFTFLTLLIL